MGKFNGPYSSPWVFVHKSPLNVSWPLCWDIKGKDPDQSRSLGQYLIFKSNACFKFDPKWWNNFSPANLRINNITQVFFPTFLYRLNIYLKKQPTNRECLLQSYVHMVPFAEWTSLTEVTLSFIVTSCCPQPSLPWIHISSPRSQSHFLYCFLLMCCGWLP